MVSSPLLCLKLLFIFDLNLSHTASPSWRLPADSIGIQYGFNGFKGRFFTPA
jgi:hypothetical protein